MTGRVRRFLGVAVAVAATALVTPTVGADPDARFAEAEAVGSPGTVVLDPTASGGRFVRTRTLQTRGQVAAGHYLLTFRLKAVQPARLDLLSQGAMVASYGVDDHWREVTATVLLDGPDHLVGVVSTSAGDAGLLDVDWLRLNRIQPRYTTVGTSILSPAGGAFSPRGANRGGYQRWPDGGAGYNTGGHEGSFMRSWGFNLVRLPLNQEFWLTDCRLAYSWAHVSPAAADGSGYTYRQAVAEEVRRFTDVGMMVVLDLHASSRGKSTGCTVNRNTDYQKEMPDLRSVEFWRSVASRFRDQQLVAFDLYNEPQLQDTLRPPADPDGVWRNGGKISYRDRLLTPQYEAVGMQRLYDVVRYEAGASNLVFVSGLRYALDVGVLLRRPLDGYGIVASPHVYCVDCTPPGPNDGHRAAIFGEPAGSPDVVGAADRFPVVVSEFGSNTPNDPTTNAAIVGWLEGHDLAWSVYSWAKGGAADGQDPWGVLADDPAEGGSRLPNPSGTPIWQVLAARR